MADEEESVPLVESEDAAVQSEDAGFDLPEAFTKPLAAVSELKEAGNDALKAKDLPTAIEKYDAALVQWDEAMSQVPQTHALNQNDLVRFAPHGFGVIETADPVFKDYALTSMCNAEMIKHKVSKYEEVVTKFKRKEIQCVPQELYELRLALLQNRALVALKLARASKAPEDWKETVMRADMALAMSGTAAKALMRKGEALVELDQVEYAAKVLVQAHQECGGRDEEVVKLLQVVMAKKGKGKGKGKKGKGKDLGKDLPAFKSHFDKTAEEAGSESSDADEHQQEPADHDRTPSHGSSSGSEHEQERAAVKEQEVLRERSGRASGGPEDDGLDGEAAEALHTRASPPSSSERPTQDASTAGGRLGGRCTSRHLAIAAGIAVVVLGNAALLMRPRAGGVAEL